MVELTKSQILALNSVSVKHLNTWHPLGYCEREFFIESTIASLVILGMGNVRKVHKNNWSGETFGHYYLPYHYTDDTGWAEVFVPKPGASGSAELRSYPEMMCCPNCGHNFDAKLHRRKGKRT